jgi:hypothetical protein
MSHAMTERTCGVAVLLLIGCLLSVRAIGQGGGTCECLQECDEDATHGFRSSSPPSNFFRYYEDGEMAETCWMQGDGADGGTRVGGTGSLDMYNGDNGVFRCQDADCLAYNEADCDKGEYLGTAAKWDCQSGS